MYNSLVETLGGLLYTHPHPLWRVYEISHLVMTSHHCYHDGGSLTLCEQLS
jgi:hypothetical protein